MLCRRYEQLVKDMIFLAIKQNAQPDSIILAVPVMTDMAFAALRSLIYTHETYYPVVVAFAYSIYVSLDYQQRVI